ncbi:hypothetical protein L5515_008865 [Caenorhabditis briggsae]|uniref:Ground-like domain-containing protein n=1 Tax=Caenorhabditis briggsae TaxID=6238 RepID=A0AAE9FA14_CAEBR|nr:hypothetical protein L5515_008865 [Caenorhabditis briggsae]
MLGCQNRCQPHAGYYQNRNPYPYQSQPMMQYPLPQQNAYPTPPTSYATPAQSYPLAPQHSIPMSSYAIAKYAVVPSYALPPAYPTPPSYPIAYPTPPAYVRPPVYVAAPPTTTTTTTTTTIPPPKCFQNSHGYKCCNRQLDQFLDEAVSQIQRPEWQRCNLQRFATQLQQQTQAIFNHSMEAIVASGHMENISQYRGDLYCKKRSMDGKVVLIYGSVVPYSLDAGVTRPMNPEELRRANYPAKYDEIGIHDGHEENIWF